MPPFGGQFIIKSRYNLPKDKFIGNDILSIILREFLMNRIPITNEGQKSGNPNLEILSVTICQHLFQVEFRIKFIMHFI